MAKHKALLERSEWLFWIQWVLASIIGWSAPWVVFWILSWLLFRGEAALDAFLGWSMGAGMGWAVAGIAQWDILRRRVPQSGRWVSASAMGGIVGTIVSVLVWILLTLVSYLSWGLWELRPIMLAVVLWGTVGFVVGMAQWVILRKRAPQSGWWVLASTVGGVVGGLVAAGVLMLLGEVEYVLGPVTVGKLAVSGAMGAAVVEATTGFVLIMLLRRSAPQAE